MACNKIVHVVHDSIWFMLMILIYWAEAYIRTVKKKKPNAFKSVVMILI
jgi:hypothetical protein